MSERVAIIACTQADMELPMPSQPGFAIDGTCAHPEIDLLDTCRFCKAPMDDDALDHRAQAWFDSL